MLYAGVERQRCADSEIPAGTRSIFMADILFIVAIIVLFWLCTLYVKFADCV